MPKAIIRHRAFPYYVDREDPTTGNTIRVELLGRRGEEVELSDADYARGERLGSFIPQPTEETPEGVLDPATADITELATWIEEDKPTVNEVVEASGGDPNIAARLLEAEEMATQGTPRKTLVDALTPIISRTEG